MLEGDVQDEGSTALELLGDYLDLVVVPMVLKRTTLREEAMQCPCGRCSNALQAIHHLQDRSILTHLHEDNMSCSTHCAPNCISRQPPGHDVLEDPPRKSVGRTYPVADPVDLQLNWQTIAVRHAWRKAAEMGDTGIGRPEEGRPLRAAEPVKANAAEADDAPGRGIDVVKI